MQLFVFFLVLVWFLFSGVVGGLSRFVSINGGNVAAAAIRFTYMTCVKRLRESNGFISMRYICHE